MRTIKPLQANDLAVALLRDALRSDSHFNEFCHAFPAKLRLKPRGDMAIALRFPWLALINTLAFISVPAAALRPTPRLTC
ncbi:hypothetical protein [Mesorhizobium retamae]|uniref:Uncharacterized protein n=1 Tax=Mesorhizobium retamae TaxID=2912854 RepID=A0ABS9QJ41_9HYPH|nr:hypothetical protein [Mesorhizobium sp. IRAMC:0171]MCG7507360.1 hypothetical protein [Mesorhizobium sp. IRAMC:0171]